MLKYPECSSTRINLLVYRSELHFRTAQTSGPHVEVPDFSAAIIRSLSCLDQRSECKASWILKLDHFLASLLFTISRLSKDCFWRYCRRPADMLLWALGVSACLSPHHYYYRDHLTSGKPVRSLLPVWQGKSLLDFSFFLRSRDGSQALHPKSNRG